MKKLACLLVVLVLMVSYTAFADEILFRDIPWGTDIDTTYSMIEDIVFSDSDEFPNVLSWDAYRPYASASAEYCTGFTAIGFPLRENIRIAGYPLQRIDAFFLYGLDNGKVLRNRENSRFCIAVYHFDVKNIERAYDDLVVKITSLYGEGVNDDGYASNMLWTAFTQDATVWKGENSTGLMLVKKVNTENEDDYSLFNDLYLVYGITNEQMIVDVTNAARQERFSDEQSNREDNKDNTDGL